MKWFQVDSDTPNDPKIRAVVRELGAEGIGGLFLVWCFVADHGRKPGRSVDASGRPISIDLIQEASELKKSEFDRLIQICVSTGHFKKDAWTKRQEIAIPAMRRRADTYTRRTSGGK